jgi:O-antigen ligase
MYLFFSSFGIETTVFHINPDDNFPIHRLYLFLTAIVFLFNLQQTLIGVLNNKSLMILVVYIAITAFWSSKPLESLKLFLSLIAMIIISIMTVMAFIDNRVGLIKKLFWLFFLVAILNAAVAQFLPQIGVDKVHFPKPRWTGITFHPNVLGANALILVWLSINLFNQVDGKFIKTLNVLAIGLAFYIIYKADSMTSMLAALAIAAYTIYVYANLRLFSKIILFLFIFIGLLFVIGFYKSPVELLSDLLEVNGRNITFTGRTVLWRKSLFALSDHLFFGYGFDNLEGLTKRQFKQFFNMSHLHNGFIEILLKGGLIGFFLLIINLFKTYYFQLKIRSKYKHDYVFLNTGFIMVIMHNFTESTLLKGLLTMDLIFIFIAVFTQLLYLQIQHENLDMHTGV